MVQNKTDRYGTKPVKKSRDVAGNTYTSLNGTYIMYTGTAPDRTFRNGTQSTVLKRTDQYGTEHDKKSPCCDRKEWVGLKEACT